MAEAKCPYFGKCGGCSAQHIDYSLQLENKKKVLVDAIKFDSVEVFSGEPYGYRNRMDFVFHPKGIGFREKGKWYKTVDVDKCVISNDRLNELALEVRDFFTDVDCFDARKKQGTYRYAVIRTPQDDSSISFVLNSDSSRIAAAVEKIKEFASQTTAKNVVVTYVHSQTDLSISDDFFVVKGEDVLNESYLDKKFKYSVQGFFQNNHAMAEKMVEYTKGLLEKYPREYATLLDVYGGVGGFGISCSDLFYRLHIVEGDKNCIEAAHKNLKLNSVERGEATYVDAKNLRRVQLSKPLFIITDPPRSGMNPKTVAQLNALEPEVIIYVSCNVKQMAKELHHLYDYKIKSAALFDLFPQTPHAEAVVELVRKTVPD